MGGRGRGGGGAGAGATVRAVANALGIARHEMASFQQPKLEPPTNYPVLNRRVLPFNPEDDKNLEYMVDVKLEINTRFHQSEFYLDHKEKKDIIRFTDKYNKMNRGKLEPDFSRLPEELCWHRAKNGHSSAKRRKLGGTANGDIIAEKLNKLEKEENSNVNREEPEAVQEDEEEEEKGSENDDVEVPSDDDYAEEDNDYISAYFDNGEGYGEGGSDENMDADEY